ncbi:MAG: GNAT family N-acetyltransferase [Defluviitaleaceae bacterium]|nr:GNAT family N-acetyltransferase [Defluviitaleaceae bacterium]
MTYEIMNSEHVEGVCKLHNEVAAEEIIFGVVPVTAEQIGAMLTPYCFVLKDRTEIVGFLLAELRHDSEFCVFPKGASYIEVHDLFIDKHYRSRGLGKTLLRHCEHEARNNGIQHMSLSSATKNAEAIRRFYTDSDYTVWTTHFFKNL